MSESTQLSLVPYVPAPPPVLVQDNNSHIAKPQANQPPTFIVLAFDVSTRRISFKPTESTPEIKTFLSKQIGISYHMGSGVFLLPAKNWHDFLTSLSGTNYTLSFILNVENEIHSFINKGDYSVSLDAKHGRIVLRKRDALVKDIYVSGITTWYAGTDYYAVSTSEAYKLTALLPKQNPSVTFDYSPEVKTLLENELKTRSALLEISIAQDAPEIPDDIKLSLKPFQRVAKKYSAHVGHRAIISYDMGLGKTAISISIAESIPNCRVLIICPATLKINWKREIQKCTPHNAVMLSGSVPDMIAINSMMNKEIKYHIMNYDILGRGDRDEDAGLFVSPWAKLINMVDFDLIILDEAHYIKNTGSGRSKAARELKSKYLLHLTGTPVVNRPGELWPLLHMIDPQTFSSKESFEGQWFYGGKTLKNPEQFRDMLSAYMIRRKREDVIKDLPTIERIDHFVEIPDAAWKSYNLALEGIYVSLANPDYEREINSILAQLQRLKQILADACAVHSASLARDIYEETEKKVLIFSQYRNSCFDITSFLGKEALCITGEDDEEERFRKIDRFQNGDDIKYLVLSTKIGAEGLTLTKAHYVIFNDLMWTPKDHRQAEARCYARLNDMHGAVAYYMQVEKTITEDIMEILRLKLQIIEETVDGVNAANIENASIINELLNRMRGK